ncbi:MAG: hypothetical protein ABJJ26_16595 [Algoriphagus sp.]|uniref:hypothetical protein n=1 Tax=Algoriphagus sp. TaxID=1872435 RepID=UPI003272F7D8
MDLIKWSVGHRPRFSALRYTDRNGLNKVVCETQTTVWEDTDQGLEANDEF